MVAVFPLVTKVDAPLHDYGKLYESVGEFEQVTPRSIEEVQEIVRYCMESGRPYRVRGSGHTFNGCTLPRKNELIVRTHELDWYHFSERNSLTVGAGALVWDIRDLAADFGQEMPVYNGGWAGPSLGGYICAGGFGKGSLSDEHGGLWENVLSILLVDGKGQKHRIKRDDPRFKWCFASYGQLGIITEVVLKTIPASPLAQLAYPTGKHGRIPRRQEEDPAENDLPAAANTSKLFWFSMLLSPDLEDLAWHATLEFCERHNDTITPDGGWAGPIKNGAHIGYRYNIHFHEFTPPLLYDRSEDFIVMGVMSHMDVGSPSAREEILDVERDFINMAKVNGLKLYLQAENIGRNIDYRDYYGNEIFNEFSRLKNMFDPAGLLNRDVIFK